ncbi:efflux RND transporter periplasmic adaptor subunit [Sphingobium yanoikuyae]|uniref:Efflux RND transporter periplasmic adaptor subunit n=1 Tax=Sphingobium yanoikuyae TaxID=13690 RepID=A0A3G2V882_SPHYA|nr:efflux RND transporter periplasmic adaptor subunit [Sphingobium yanoikuyae]QJR05490.1 efflux RND transporter periplasmic adaptor subunit [Sphingobium yanoikuyae]
MRTTSLLFLPLSALVMLGACSQQGKQSSSPPSHGEVVAHETELVRLTLKPEAVKRLGIETTRVGAGTAALARETSGEIVVPNGTGGVPTGALSNLAQIGASQASADGEVERTRAQVRLARIALERASRLVAEEAGSVRARDEAAAALATAQAQAQVAIEQRRLLGPAVASLGNQSRLWVRVSVAGTDVAAINRNASIIVAPLGTTQGGRKGTPVQAPPSANAVAGTVDLYYALDNSDQFWRVGQRVGIRLPLGKTQEGLSVPASAIVRDIYGGEWVYLQTAPGNFIRQRIEALSSGQDGAVVIRGLAPEAQVVSVGAMELFGTEFGVAH